MKTAYINHVLSSGLLKSTIFEHLIARAAAATPTGTRITRTDRPDLCADVWHYHRPNLEWRLRPRSIATVHHDLRDDRAWLAQKHYLARYREASLVHCLNSTQRAILAEVGIAHSEVVPHGIDRRALPLPERPRQWAGGRLRLGLFSRHYAAGEKGEELLHNLFSRMDRHRVSFVLVGHNRSRDAEVAKAHGYEVECWDRVPYSVMGELYRRIDALLILSRFEGGPASLPEALGSGIPVFCTPVGMCPDMIQDGENGMILSGRADNDTDRIMALLDQDGRRLQALNDGAFRTAPLIPPWERVMARWYGFCQIILQ